MVVGEETGGRDLDVSIRAFVELAAERLRIRGDTSTATTVGTQAATVNANWPVPTTQINDDRRLIESNTSASVDLSAARASIFASNDSDVSGIQVLPASAGESSSSQRGVGALRAPGARVSW